MFDQEQELIEDSEPERVLRRSLQESVRISSQILNHGLVSPDIIELTDEERDVEPVQSWPTNRALNVPNCAVATTPEHRRRLIPKEFPDARGASDGGSDEEEIIDLSRFAYPNARSSMTMACSVPYMAITQSKQNSKIVKSGPRKAHFLVDGLSDSHFTRLTKCVSCDARWTTRKTIGQKIKHIQSCSKRHGLTVETVRAAVLREIAATTATAVNDSIEKEDEPDPALATLLRNTVDAVAAGKRSRRRLLKTVQCVTQTRDAIMERAKNILTHSAQISDASQVESVEDDEAQLPSTQLFGQSVLARERVFKSDLFAAASVDVVMKDECRFESGNAECSNHRLRHGNDAPSQVKSLCGAKRYGVKENRDNGLKISAERLARKETLANRYDTNVESSQKDEQWTQQFKSLILQDRNLHLSILHYEPIHFDVFRKLAEANGLKTVNFRTSIRAYLDREAIHYYGAEPQGSRRRRG